MVSAARRQIIGGDGGAPIKKSRRRKRPQIVGGGGAARPAHGSSQHCSQSPIRVRCFEVQLKDKFVSSLHLKRFIAVSLG